MTRCAPFTGSFTQQEPIGEDGIAAAIAVLRSGRLHRYNTRSTETSEASKLESAFARYMGLSYCLACASGGYALHIALCAAGVQPGDAVLTNAFTLAPVPGAIVNAGASPVYVEITPALTIDLADLERKLDTTGARFLLLSHMRGHMADMDAVIHLLADYDVTLIEDCAHTMGARWNGRPSGSFGLVSCFSTQTYKHINSGEGGLLVTNDAELMARATLMSGSYMLYNRHGTPPEEGVFAAARLTTPNFSGRMDNLRASILVPQLTQLDANVDRWNARYALIDRTLRITPMIELPSRPVAERYVGSSIQFRVPTLTDDEAASFVEACSTLGVEIKWFGRDEPVGFTSTYKSWLYTPPATLPQTDRVLSRLFDMRIPLTFSLSDCIQIGEIILFVLSEIRNSKGSH